MPIISNGEVTIVDVDELSKENRTAINEIVECIRMHTIITNLQKK